VIIHSGHRIAISPSRPQGNPEMPANNWGPLPPGVTSFAAHITELANDQVLHTPTGMVITKRCVDLWHKFNPVGNPTSYSPPGITRVSKGTNKKETQLSARAPEDTVCFQTYHHSCSVCECEKVCPLIFVL